MREVRVAHESGACFGVERALRLAYEAAEEATAPVYTLGPLIHNPLVIADLGRAGVTPVEDPLDAEEGATLLLRAHGVTPELEQRARERGLKVVDATCPFVKKVHAGARNLMEQGYDVLVAGEKGHPEVEGTVGHAPGAHVVGGAGDVESLELGRRVGVVSQTTLTHGVLRDVVAALVGRCEELHVMDTICEATNRRQTAAAELAREVDVMVVVGGLNSANTTHLADVCRMECPRTYHVESASHIRADWLEDASAIGVTAGASTPAEHIREAVKVLQTL